MVGDSVGYSLSESLAEVGRASAIDVAVRAAPGCSLTEERAVFQNGPETNRQPASVPRSWRSGPTMCSASSPTSW